MTLLAIFFAGVFTSNLVFVQGGAGLFNSSLTTKKVTSALLFGLIVIIVMALSSVILFALNKYILVKYNVEYLKLIMVVIIVSFLVQIAEFIVKKVSPRNFVDIGPTIPLMASSTSVLSVAVNSLALNSVLEALVYGFSYGLGFAMVLFIMSSVRENIPEKNLPTAFKGMAIPLIILFLLCIVMSGVGSISLL